MNTVYVDESGATGNNVDDLQQPFFTMASVSLTAAEAAQLGAAIRERVLTGAELKASKLLKRPEGLDAIRWLVAELGDRAKAIAYSKDVAVFLKLYDYVLDPIDPHVFGPAMRDNVHRCVAQALHTDSELGVGTAGRLRAAIVSSMARADDSALMALAANPPARIDSFSDLVHALIAVHSESILKEVKEMRALESAGRWQLELSAPALNWIAAYWSRRSGPIEVVCDESIPIREQTKFIEQFLSAGADQRQPSDDPDFQIPALVRSFSTVKSKQSLGVQLADLVAGYVRSALQAGNTIELASLVLRRVSVLPALPGLPLPPSISLDNVVGLLSSYLPNGRS